MLGVVVCVYNPSTQEAEVEGLKAQGLNYIMRPSLKNQNQNQTKPQTKLKNITKQRKRHRFC
jgi:hypothetical protein